MAELKIIGTESFDYQFDGDFHSYRVDELEDGYWSITTDHELFRAVNGSRRLYKVSSVSEAFLEMAVAHEKLAKAMLEPFGNRCRKQVAGFCLFIRDRRMFYHFN